MAPGHLSVSGIGEAERHIEMPQRNGSTKPSIRPQF
jgi:hypothetical protein